MLIVAGILKINPSKRPVLEAAFDKVREATLKEQGCLSYQIYVDRADPGTFLLFEKWESEAALNAHFATPHMAEFGKALGGADIVSADVNRYDVSRETKMM